MGVTKFLARDLEIAILDPASGTDYVRIKGLNTLTHSPSSSDADTSDFDSGGRDEHLKAARGDSWSLAGFTLEDPMTGDRDPGQAAVELAAQEVGPSAMRTYKITSPGGNTIIFDASVEVTLAGGGTNDAAAWAATVHVSGPVQFS